MQGGSSVKQFIKSFRLTIGKNCKYNRITVNPTILSPKNFTIFTDTIPLVLPFPDF
jgi:hypothetical protein